MQPKRGFSLRQLPTSYHPFRPWPGLPPCILQPLPPAAEREAVHCHGRQRFSPGGDERRGEPAVGVPQLQDPIDQRPTRGGPPR